MTIHEHNRVSADRDGNSPSSTHALVDRLTAGEPYAVAFGGQGSAWLETLEELVSSAGIETNLATLVGEVELLLEPVRRIARGYVLPGLVGRAEVRTARHELSLPPKLTYGQIKGFTLYATRTILSGGGAELVELTRTNLRELEAE